MSRWILAATLLAGLGFVCSFPALADQKKTEWGTIQGQVILNGDSVPERRPIDVSANANAADCLAKGPILPDDLVVNPKNKGIRWAFVWLEPQPGGPPLKIHPNLEQIKQKNVVVDQPCCMFEPHCIGIRQGQDLLAKNTAKIAHNINWTGSIKNPGGNVLIPAGQEFTIAGLQTDRFPVKIACNIHGWMSGWVRIFDHPYFAVTDEDGKFEIKDAPAGNFVLKAWQETKGYVPDRKGTPIAIKGGDVTKVGDIKLQ